MEVYTRKTAAEKMLVSVRTIDNLIQMKALEVRRLGKSIRITGEAIEKCLSQDRLTQKAA